jgi:hypothetical protein
LGANESAGEVISIVSEILCYRQPSQAANELRVQGEQAAISVGDMNWACINRVQYCAHALWVGTHLSNVSEVNIRTPLPSVTGVISNVPRLSHSYIQRPEYFSSKTNTSSVRSVACIIFVRGVI